MRHYYAALMYTVLGLASGLFYREYTKAHEFTGATELGTVHTHLLGLGLTVTLVVLALDAVFGLTGRGPFTWFFWLFHLGVLVTSVMMAVRGVLTVDGLTPAETSAAIPGIAGLGHMLVTAGLALLFVALYSGVRERQARLETGRTDPYAPARALYERHGFVECPPFGDYGPDPNSIFMTLTLPDDTA